MVAWIIYDGIALALTVVAFPDRWQRILTIPYFIAVFVVGCIVLVPFDRVYEGRYRKLEKMRDDTHAT